jgi:hypothetical protein
MTAVVSARLHMAPPAEDQRQSRTLPADASFAMAKQQSELARSDACRTVLLLSANARASHQTLGALAA